MLASTALVNDCRIALYGHTHVADATQTPEGVLCINPGALSGPRDRVGYCELLLEGSTFSYNFRKLNDL